MNTDMTPLKDWTPVADQPQFRYDENLPGIPRFDWSVRKPTGGEKRDDGFVLMERAYVLDKSTRSCYVWRDGEWRNDFTRGFYNWNDEKLSVEEWARRLSELDREHVWAWSTDGFWSVRDVN